MKEENTQDLSKSPVQIQYGRRKKQIQPIQTRTEKLESLNSVSFESNDSIVRRKKRSQIKKLTKPKKKKSHSLSGAFDPKSPIDIIEGLVQIESNGCGYFRNSEFNYHPKDNDIFISKELVEKYGLKNWLVS